MRRSPLRRIVVCVGGSLIALAFAGSCFAQQSAPPSGGPVYDPFVTITVSKDAKTGAYALTAVPYVALRPPKGSLKWNIAQQPAGYSIEFDFAVTNGAKGPFPRNAKAADNPAKGRYTNKPTGKNTIETASSSEKADTSWKYTVTLRDASDNDVTTLDPIVIFK
jgi:hypothetical protein